MNRKIDEASDWPKRLAAAIGEQVRDLRKSQGLSAQDLADRTATLGHEVKRSVISDMEIGRRPTVALPDVLVLARALSVPPISLIAPVAEGSKIEVLASDYVDPWDAIDWINGASANLNSPRSWLKTIDDVRDSDRIWYSATEPHMLKGQLDVAIGRWIEAWKDLEELEPGSSEHKYAAAVVQSERRQVRALRDEFAALHVQVPEIPLDLFKDTSHD